MEQTNQVTKTCGGNCLQCSFQQRVYCASQISHDMFITLQSYNNTLQKLNATIDEIKGKLSDQSTSNELINPLKDNINDVIAQ